MDVSKTFSIEKFFRVYNDKHGNYTEIRPDADGLGMVEIRQVDNLGKTEREMVFELTEFYAVVKACNAFIKEFPRLGSDYYATQEGVVHDESK